MFASARRNTVCVRIGLFCVLLLSIDHWSLFSCVSRCVAVCRTQRCCMCMSVVAYVSVAVCNLFWSFRLVCSCELMLCSTCCEMHLCVASLSCLQHVCFACSTCLALQVPVSTLLFLSVFMICFLFFCCAYAHASVCAVVMVRATRVSRFVEVWLHGFCSACAVIGHCAQRVVRHQCEHCGPCIATLFWMSCVSCLKCSSQLTES